MTLFEARSVALEKLATNGYMFNWPGRVVALRSPASGGDGICFAIPMDDSSSADQFIRSLGENWNVPSYWKVFLQPKIVAWRWRDRWHWQTDRVFVYSLTDEDHEAFVRFCDSGAEA